MATSTKQARAGGRKPAGKAGAPAGRRASGASVRKAAVRKAPASAGADDFLDPLQQLAKLSGAAPAPSTPRSRTRGASVGESQPSADEPTMPADFFSGHTGATLSEQDFADAAQTLACEVAAVKAVAEVESRGAGFGTDRRPTILYERHVFARCTAPQGKFDHDHPDVSGFRNPYPPGTYGNREQQYLKLARAFQLDPDAALKAPSWGMFQILGENHKACGFASVVLFAQAMTQSEGEHLKAFINFVRSNAGLLQAIRKKDWTAFARSYNGPNFATFKYDTKMAAAYARHAGTA